MKQKISEEVPIVLCGCGEMGLPMAKRLQIARLNVRGFDIRSQVQFRNCGISMCGSSEARQCEVLISVVRDAAETDELCFGEQGMFVGESYPRILIVCSTLVPSYLSQLGTSLPGDVELVDAPMSGASVAAIEGNLTFMLGGKMETLDYLKPIFSAMGKQLFYAGNVGAGMTLKVLNNYVAATSVVAVRRVLNAANHVGIDQKLLREVMSKSSGETWFGNRFEDIEWAQEGYAADNTIGILEKDVQCALSVLVNQEHNPHPEDEETLEIESKFDNALISSLQNMRGQTN